MIYAIKTLAGTYYNQRDNAFHSTSIYNAWVTSNKLKAEGILKKLKLKGHNGLFIYEITENKLLETEGYYDEFMMLCGKVQVHETADLIRIIKAYKKDAKSINGLTKKILE